MFKFSNSPFNFFRQESQTGQTSPNNQGGITPRTIQNEAERLIEKGTTEKKVNRNYFPKEAFPTAVQNIIYDTNKCLNYPIDFIGASLLFAAGLSIGNSHQIQVKKTWCESPVLYLALVGKPGTIKSHPLSFALQPIQKYDQRTYKEYEEQKQKYDYAISLSKKEREKSGIGNPEKPSWKKYIVSDITPESLAEVHKYNTRGIGLYSDELAGWFKNFNRYNNGSEEQFWLSSWSCKPVNVDRKSGDPILISNPFISVAGTIQLGILKELSSNNRNQNGFIDRILFAFPDFFEKPYWNEGEVLDVTVDKWSEIIINLLNLPFETSQNISTQPEILKLNLNAKRIYIEWHDKNIDLYHAPENDAVAGAFTKLNQYTLRFALILQLLGWACGERNKECIEVESINGAIKLADYFRNTASRVHDIVSNPLAQLPEDKQKLFKALPDHFTTAEGLEISKSLLPPVPEDTFNKFLSRYSGTNQVKLFRKIKKGLYEKLL